MSIAERLRERGLSPKKRFGQNFLVDVHAQKMIAEAATTPTGGTVLEIGPGMGALTRPLLERAGHVVVIERDRDLVPLLSADFAEQIAAGRLQIVEGDAMAQDWAALLQGHPKPHVIAGNLPYLLTGPLLERATTLVEHVDRVVFMVQLEVAERLMAKPSTKEYGALTVFVQAAFDVRRVLTVRAGAFYPRPDVDCGRDGCVSGCSAGGVWYASKNAAKCVEVDLRLVERTARDACSSRGNFAGCSRRNAERRGIRALCGAAKCEVSQCLRRRAPQATRSPQWSTAR